MSIDTASAIENKLTTCVVIDEDIIALRVMKSYIMRVGSLSLVHMFDDIDEAIKFLYANEVELVFWNLENSFFVDRTGVLKELPYQPRLVVSSMEAPLGEGVLACEPDGWLPKPLNSYLEFANVIDNVLTEQVDSHTKKLSSKADYNLFVKVDSTLKSLSLSEVLWIEAYGDYVKIHTTDTTHIILSKFQMILDKLPKEEFVRVHRSHLIRIDKISKIEQTSVHLGDQVVPISRTFKREFLDRIVVL